MQIRIKTKPPGPKAKEWLEHYHRHAAPSTYAYPFVWDITKEASGSYCTDPDGNVFLDMYGHVGAAPLGYNHKAILKDCGVPFDPIKIAGHDTYIAVGDFRGKRKLALKHRAAHDFRTATDLQHKLIEITKHFGFDAVFLVNSGAEAVSNAVKICAYRCYKKLKQELGSSIEELFHQLGIERDTFIPGLYTDYPIFGIACNRAFHGRTLGALSHTHSKLVQKEGFPAIRWIRRIPFSEKIETLEELIEPRPLEELLKNGELSSVIAKGKIPKELLAYIIVEPVQGEGGYRIPSKQWMQRLYEFAKENDAMFISDEIQAGLGRTGKMWAIEHYKIKPDVITSAKALRVGAVLSSSDIFPVEQGKISATWSGGELAIAVGYKTLEVIERENLIENAAKIGEYAIEKLRKLQRERPDCIVDTRGLGLMLALEFKTKELRDKVVDSCFERGLLTLGCGEKALRMLPRLGVTEAEIDEAISVLRSVLSDI